MLLFKKPRIEPTGNIVRNVQIGKQTQSVAEAVAGSSKQAKSEWGEYDDDELYEISTQVERKVTDSLKLEESFHGFPNSSKRLGEKPSTQVNKQMLPPPQPPPALVNEEIIDLINDNEDTDMLLSQYNFEENVQIKKAQDQNKQQPSTSKFNFRSLQQQKKELEPSQITVSGVAKNELKKLKATDLESKNELLQMKLKEKIHELEVAKEEKKTFTERIEIKEGHISTLKLEIETLQQENERLKAVRIQESESHQKANEMDKKIMEMSKQIHHLQSELNVKEYEVGRLRIRRSRLSEAAAKESPFKIYRNASGTNWMRWITRTEPTAIDERILVVNDLEVLSSTGKLLNQLQTLVSVLSVTGTLPKTIKHISLIREIVQIVADAADSFKKLDVLVLKDMDYPGAEDRFLFGVLDHDIGAFASPEGYPVTIFDSACVTQDEHEPVNRRCLALFSIALKNDDICKGLLKLAPELFGHIRRLLYTINHSQEMWKGIGFIMVITKIISIISSKPLHLAHHRDSIVQTFKLLLNNSMSNLEVLEEIATFLSNIKETQTLSALCMPAPTQRPQFIFRNIAMRIQRDCCPLLTLGIKMQAAMRYSIFLEYHYILSLCLKVGKFLKVCSQSNLEWYENQRLNSSCGCVFRLLHGLAAVQYTVIQKYMTYFFTESKWNINGKIDKKSVNLSVQLSLSAFNDILIRLKYREQLWMNREAQNQVSAVLMLILVHMGQFNLDLTAEYMLDALQTPDTADYVEPISQLPQSNSTLQMTRSKASVEILNWLD